MPTQNNYVNPELPPPRHLLLKVAYLIKKKKKKKMYWVCRQRGHLVGK